MRWIGALFCGCRSRTECDGLSRAVCAGDLQGRTRGISPRPGVPTRMRGREPVFGTTRATSTVWHNRCPVPCRLHDLIVLMEVGSEGHAMRLPCTMMGHTEKMGTSNARH